MSHSTSVNMLINTRLEIYKYLYFTHLRCRNFLKVGDNAPLWALEVFKGAVEESEKIKGRYGDPGGESDGKQIPPVNPI